MLSFSINRLHIDLHSTAAAAGCGNIYFSFLLKYLDQRHLHRAIFFKACLCEYPGAAYCQLMDCLFPGSLDLSRVRFQSSNMVDSIHNYSLLQAAFREVEVKRVSAVTNQIWWH